MIISKTPYRISFFGGGSDYPSWYNNQNGEVLSTTIDKYLYINVRNLPPFFEHKYRVSYSSLETSNNIMGIKHKVVREAIKFFKLNNGLEINYAGDIPSRSGMGSSSSFVVGLLNSLNYLKNKKIINKRDLALDAINFEQNTLKEDVGAQDQVIATYGGFNSIKFQKNKIFSIQKSNISDDFKNYLNKNLLLMYTGQVRTAQIIAKSFVNKINSEKKNEIYEILDHVKLAKKIIKNEDILSFGKLLNDSWKIKKKLSKNISNSVLDDIYNLAITKGALGGKILGAGGGGFFLFLVPLEKQKKFKSIFNKYLFIPFDFSNKGTEIIFDSEKKY